LPPFLMASIITEHVSIIVSSKNKLELSASINSVTDVEYKNLLFIIYVSQRYNINLFFSSSLLNFFLTAIFYFYNNSASIAASQASQQHNKSLRLIRFNGGANTIPSPFKKSRSA
jgi:hypothetical protein